LEHLSGALAVFLPRRMYENYLLHRRAIAAVANGIENFRESGTPVTKEEVSTLLIWSGQSLKTIVRRRLRAIGKRTFMELMY